MNIPTGVWGQKKFLLLKCNTREDNSSLISYHELIYLLYSLLNYKQIIKEKTFIGEEGKRKIILECEAGLVLEVVCPTEDWGGKGQYDKKGHSEEGK